MKWKFEKDFWKGIKHFKPEEWGEWEKCNPKLIKLIDELRDKAEFPIIIHEAYATSGHAPNSYHYRGEAVDFHFGHLTGRDGSTRIILPYRKQFGLILQMGCFFGVGFYFDWKHPGWHLDLRPVHRSQFWTRKNGKYHMYLK